MSFHKRYYTHKNVHEYAKSNDYVSFEKFMVSSDIQVFEDDETKDLWLTFLKAKEEIRRKTYQDLRDK